MTQTKRRTYLIAVLLKEQPQYSKIEIPSSEAAQKILLRSLLNIRMPLPLNDAFLTVQDAYLQEAIRQKALQAFGFRAASKGAVSLARGYYHPAVRCDCKCRQQPNALCAVHR